MKKLEEILNLPENKKEVKKTQKENNRREKKTTTVTLIKKVKQNFKFHKWSH